MTIEEKAKAYDEAYKKVAIRFGSNVADEIFPELKESEDNIIIKALKSGFKMLEREYNLKGLGGIKFEKILTWLEKQGEEKPNPYSGTSFEYNGHTWGMCARDNGVEILIDGHLDRVFTIDSNAKEMFIKALERVEEQNAKGYKLTDCDKNSWWEDFKAYTYCTIEQKTADNVEPKFHEGDWVVYCNDDVDLITGIEENGYRINNGGYIPFICENEMRLWDITDAKVGDVLVSESTCGLGTWYCIFKSLDGDESMTVHCYLSRDGRFETKKELCFDKDPFNTKPATKEQRDLLFQKMKEVGYEWDTEKKELKKIDIPIFNIGDTIIKKHNSDIHDFGSFTITDITGGKYWYNDRIICDITEQDEWEIYKLAKQTLVEWSKEDKIYLDHIITAIKSYYTDDKGKENPWREELLRWLESLKERYTWKPSDRQMQQLGWVAEQNEDNLIGKELMTLYKDLKKLRKE